MWNQPKKAPSAPASNAANPSTKTATDAKPEAIVTPAPVVAPTETKKI